VCVLIVCVDVLVVESQLGSCLVVVVYLCVGRHSRTVGYSDNPQSIMQYAVD